MFHSWKIEHKINKIHERAVRFIYPSDSKLTFKELLDENKIASIHQKNLQVLATEIFKAKLNISPEILKFFFFLIRDSPFQIPAFNIRNYILTSQSSMKRIKTNSVYFGTEDMGLGSRQLQKWKVTIKV